MGRQASMPVVERYEERRIRTDGGPIPREPYRSLRSDGWKLVPVARIGWDGCHGLDWWFKRPVLRYPAAGRRRT